MASSSEPLSREERKLRAAADRFQAIAKESERRAQKSQREAQREAQRQVQASWDKYDLGPQNELDSIPSLPEFSPSMAEFRDPIGYLTRCQAEASYAGGCVINAPADWPVQPTPMPKAFRFSARAQKVRRHQKNKDGKLGFLDHHRQHTHEEFSRQASAFRHKVFPAASHLKDDPPPRIVERTFWDHVEHDSPDALQVTYGNDIPHTRFPPSSSNEPWNLNNLPLEVNSTLAHSSDYHFDVPGVTSPMLYVGMMFGMFCWYAF
jgi:histone demethylase JARID1